MLQAKNLHIGYSTDKTLIQDANFEIKRGDFVALIGRNGTGKTTLLKTLIGHQKALEGNCFIQEKNIQNLSNQQLAKIISIVNTERIRLPYLKVSELLALGRFPYTNFMGKLNDSDHTIIEKTVFDLDIQHLTNKQLSQLSDGELQKVLIGRAIIQDTPIVLLDEPTTHLDLVNRYQIFKLLKDLSKNQNKGILLSTHELELAFDLATKILFLNDKGQLIAASTDQFIKDKRLQSTFESDGIVFDPSTRRFKYY